MMDPRPYPSDDEARLVYAALERLLDAARDAVGSASRNPLLLLARHCLEHPALRPFRDDPLRTLGGRFLSLDARVATLRNVLAAGGMPVATVGSVGATLYMPWDERVVVCRVLVAVLSSHPLDRWERPVPVQPMSPDLEASANRAFDAVLHTLLFVSPDGNPPTPRVVYWSVDGAEAGGLAATSGDSLELPLALAFLSALTGIPVPTVVGATGAIRDPDRVAPVGFVAAKRNAYFAAVGVTARFLTSEDGRSIAEFAAGLDDTWAARFARTSPEALTTLAPGEHGTFLWAEIGNVPALWETHAAELRELLPRFETLFEAAVRGAGGQRFGRRPDTGEGTGAVFRDPGDAVRAATMLLLSVRASPRGPAAGEASPPRVGIARGAGEPIGDTWRGTGPAQARRVADAASAGQILATDSVHRAMAPLDWVAWGAHRLRDSPGTVTLWQVVAPGLPRVDVPPESLDTRPHDLPVYASELIGRSAEMAAVSAAIIAERIVTLTGTGGVGKSRLAAAAAADALLNPCLGDLLTDGAFYVPLDARVGADAANILGAIRAAIGIGEAGRLAAKKCLLLLDNAEGVLGVLAPLVNTLLTAAPGIRFLITSRIPLRLRGEKRITVAPLRVPRRDSSPEEWEGTPSVRLFRERARAAVGDSVAPVGGDREALTRLLWRLDGIPLAIELAAARTRYLPVPEIEARLSGSLRLLSTREGNVPERHRTLLGTLQWSYDLLGDAEKTLLLRVTAFAGGFDPRAVEGVSGDAPGTFDSLTSLEEQSLLYCPRSDKGEPPRFHLLQTVSDFALEKLSEMPGGVDAAAQAHARYFFDLAARNGDERVTRTDREAEAFDALDREMGNLRAAWLTLRELGDAGRIATFAANLSPFLRRRGHARERADWLEAALRVAPTGALRQRLRLAWALAAAETGRAEDAAEVARLFSDAAIRTRNVGEQADAERLFATLAGRAGHFDVAEGHFDRSEALYREAGDRRGLATVYNNRAVNAIGTGDDARARHWCESALTLCRETGDERGEAYASNNLGYLLSESGDHDEALPHFRRQMRHCQAQRDTLGCAVSLFNIGDAWLNQGRADGLPLLVAATELFARLGHPNASTALSRADEWLTRTDTAQGALHTLRRAASRRTLAELRETPTESH